jgi:hypothetical protein
MHATVPVEVTFVGNAGRRVVAGEQSDADSANKVLEWGHQRKNLPAVRPFLPQGMRPTKRRKCGKSGRRFSVNGFIRSPDRIARK